MSNKYRSSVEVDDFLNKQLIKRKQEIIYLKLLLKEYMKKESKISTVLAKSLFVISYSHWEGYVKETVEAYLSYLNFKDLKYCDLNVIYKASYLHSALYSNQLPTNRAIEKIVDVLSNDSFNVVFPTKYMSDCESNLKFEVFLKVLKRIGLTSDSWNNFEQFIDGKILKNRNDFAHGDDLRVSESDALAVADKVIIMMNQFNNEVSNQMNTKKYLNIDINGGVQE